MKVFMYDTMAAKSPLILQSPHGLVTLITRWRWRTNRTGPSYARSLLRFYCACRAHEWYLLLRHRLARLVDNGLARLVPNALGRLAKPLEPHRSRTEAGDDRREKIDAEDIPPEAPLVQRGIDKMLHLRMRLGILAPVYAGALVMHGVIAVVEEKLVEKAGEVARVVPL